MSLKILVLLALGVAVAHGTVARKGGVAKGGVGKGAKAGKGKAPGTVAPSAMVAKGAKAAKASKAGGSVGEAGAVGKAGKSASKSSKAAATLGVYPEYAGANTGVMSTVMLTASAESLTLTASLTGLPVSHTAGFHIHSGSSCATAAEVGGHWYNTTMTGLVDPWTTTYTSDASGNAKISVTLTAAELGYNPTMSLDRTFVIHGVSDKIACGVFAAHVHGGKSSKTSKSSKNSSSTAHMHTGKSSNSTGKSSKKVGSQTLLEDSLGRAAASSSTKIALALTGGLLVVVGAAVGMRKRRASASEGYEVSEKTPLTARPTVYQLNNHGSIQMVPEEPHQVLA